MKATFRSVELNVSSIRDLAAIQDTLGRQLASRNRQLAGIAEQRIAPVVILTAFSQRDLVERARDAGMLPAGDNGTYFQFFPLERLRVSLDDARTKLSRANELWGKKLIARTELEVLVAAAALAFAFTSGGSFPKLAKLTDRLAIVLLVTDGVPSVGEQAPDRIAEQAGARAGNTRIFTVGLGHYVNTYLLDRLASRGRGSVDYVPPGASVETAMGAILSKLRFPALVDLRIGETPVGLSEVYPAQLPDLFFGEELVVFGRYREPGSGRVVVTGRRNGRRARLVVPASFPRSEPRNDFIPRLWAARRIGELTRQIRLEGPSPALISQVRDLGLRYGILTEYTSYLVQEPLDLAGPDSPRRLEEDQLNRAASPASQTGAGRHRIRLQHHDRRIASRAGGRRGREVPCVGVRRVLRDEVVTRVVQDGVEVRQHAGEVEINYEFMDVHRRVPIKNGLAAKDAPYTVPLQRLRSHELRLSDGREVSPVQLMHLQEPSLCTVIPSSSRHLDFSTRLSPILPDEPASTGSSACAVSLPHRGQAAWRQPRPDARRRRRGRGNRGTSRRRRPRPPASLAPPPEPSPPRPPSGPRSRPDSSESPCAAV